MKNDERSVGCFALLATQFWVELKYATAFFKYTLNKDASAFGFAFGSDVKSDNMMAEVGIIARTTTILVLGLRLVRFRVRCAFAPPPRLRRCCPQPHARLSSQSRLPDVTEVVRGITSQ